MKLQILAIMLLLACYALDDSIGIIETSSECKSCVNNSTNYICWSNSNLYCCSADSDAKQCRKNCYIPDPWVPESRFLSCPSGDSCGKSTFDFHYTTNA